MWRDYFPPWLVRAVLIAAGLEVFIGSMPLVLLSWQRYKATESELVAKTYQPALLDAQVRKAKFDADIAANQAEASVLQPETTRMQLQKLRYDATAAEYQAAAAKIQPDLLRAQIGKLEYDTTVARYAALAAPVQPQINQVQLDKLKLETITAAIQPKLMELQVAKLAIDTKVAGMTLPVTAQGLDLSNAILGAMSPMMKSFMGINGAPPRNQGTATVRSPNGKIVHLLSAPDSGSDSVADMPNGAAIEIEGVDGAWAHVRAFGDNGRTFDGYVPTKFVQK